VLHVHLLFLIDFAKQDLKLCSVKQFQQLIVSAQNHTEDVAAGSCTCWTEKGKWITLPSSPN